MDLDLVFVSVHQTLTGCALRVKLGLEDWGLFHQTLAVVPPSELNWVVGLFFVSVHQTLTSRALRVKLSLEDWGLFHQTLTGCALRVKLGLERRHLCWYGVRIW